jgi:uncharacterized membrane protein
VSAAPKSRVERYRQLYFTGPSTERTVFFSDAVFAIAMTLLVLEIKVPGGDELEREGISLGRALADIWYEFFGYALSFFFVASTWLLHHNVWRFVTAVNPRSQWLNMMLLFFVAFTPVPTAVIADYGPSTPVAPVFYALTIAAVGASLLLLLMYCHRAGLLSESMEPDMYYMVRRQLILSPAVFVGSCVIALLWKPVVGSFAPAAADLGPLIAMLSWSSLWVVFAISNRQVRRLLRRHDREDAAATAAADAALSTD